mgnify:CR=1 FL=1
MKQIRIISLTLILVIVMTACAAADEPILTVTDKTYTKSELEALGVIEVDYTNKDGETTTFNGVPLSRLLTDAGISQPGKTLIFIAGDGYEAETTIDEVVGCVECIIAFDNNTLRMVMPELSSKLQVKDLVKISIK